MPKIEIEIGGDNTDLQRKIAEAEILLKRLRKDVAVELKSGNIDLAEKMTVEVNQAKKSLQELQGSYKSTTVSTNTLTKATGNGSNTLLQFSRIAQDAPFGIMGIGNNITATAESFGYLSKSSGGAGNALKAVASSLLGTGGILLAVSLVTSALTYMSQNGITMADVFDRLSGKAKDFAKINLNKAFALDEVVTATQNIQSLSNQVELAKNGFINKKDVVDEYNKTIGKTIGVVKDLDGVEQMLVKNGEAYIKMTLLKAAANIAQEDAAKQTIEAEKSRQKKLTEFNNAFLDADLTQTRSKEQYDAKQANLQTQLINRKKEEVKINEDAANANLRIAKKFNADAAAIAKKFNFSFGGNFNTDTIKTDSIPKLEPINIETKITTTAVIENQQKEGQKVLKTIQDTLNIAASDFKIQPIALEIPLKPIIPPDILTFAEQQLIDFNENVNDLIQGSLVDTFSSLGEALGNALATGGNVLNALGGALLGALGGFLGSLGKQMVAFGVTALFFDKTKKSLFTGVGTPAAAVGLIAAGIAISAIGSAISATANKGLSQGGSGGGGGTRAVSTDTGNNSFRGSTSGGSGVSTSGGFQSVVFEISGNSLIGVLENSLQKNRRLGGNLAITS